MNSLISLLQLEFEYLLAEGNFAVIPYIIVLIIGLLFPTIQ
ncbi:MAG TPA: hypothetical protein PLJ47_14900 [Candidatus Hydrogenedentes bacterium]|nr:hypothetical protein [Candidatus Hydrogenedentota bacterium]HRK35883.1 hypothetical protein [Candidatus Hydrogenedentota bacterium]